MLFRKFPRRILFMFIKLFFKGFNKRLLDKYNSEDDMPIELRSIYESLLKDQDQNGVPDVFEEKGAFKSVLENRDIFIVNNNNLDSLSPEVRKKYEALMRDQNYNENNYSSDNSQKETLDLYQEKHNSLDNISDEDIGIYKRNSNNTFSSIFVRILVIVGLIVLGAMLFERFT